MAPPIEPRTVFGLTAEAWGVGAAVVVIVAICLDSIACFLASVSAVRVRQPERPSSSLPACREARKARRGVWR
jgi:hypothetical protein